MKKNLKLIVFAIVLCAVSVLNVKVMLNTEHSSDLLMTSLASMGQSNSTEEGGGSCTTDTTGDVTMQDCRGVKMYNRVTITYTCQGNGLGICDDGVEYYFYDCEGAVIAHNEYISTKSCE